MRKIYDLLFKAKLNIIKTIYFNFKVFPFKIAIRFPVWLFNKVRIVSITRGCIQLTNTVRPGTVRVGGGYESYLVSYCSTFVTYLKIKGTLSCGSTVHMGNGLCLYIAPNAVVELGDEVFINSNVKLFCEENIFIGSRSRISWDAQVFDSNFHYTSHNGIVHRKSHPISLSHNCWIGNKVTVSKGTVLPAYSIVASNSVINKDFSKNEEGGMYAGTPAKLISSGFKRLIGKGIEEKIDNLFKDGRETVDLTELT